MPAIRDATWTWQAATSGSLRIPMCAHKRNDLLVCFVMGDTGAPTWTAPAGFTQLFAQNNTASHQCTYKIATSDKEDDIWLRASVTENYNGCVIAIRDVHTTLPFGSGGGVFVNATQASATLHNLPQITTTRDNSMLLYWATNSGTGNAPAIISGSVTHLIDASGDGQTESMGVGWGFKKTAGNTFPVSAIHTAGGAGIRATIQIWGNIHGSRVIPTYVVEDFCTLLDPLTGTAWNSNGTMTSVNMATNWIALNSNLGGTPANQATVGTADNTGVYQHRISNSLLSVAVPTTATVQRRLNGAELVFASSRSIGTRNVLCHLTPSAASSAISLPSSERGSGSWIGLRSAAASNFKIWHVHGRNSENNVWGWNETVPVIINTGAGNTKATNGTLSATAVTAIGFWVSSTWTNVVTWYVSSLWMMAHTTLAGGNSAEPMGINSIVNALATGKERISAARLGANHMLLLQHVRFGDGGTNPIFLDLNGTSIEFPRQYSPATGEVNYNSTDNVIGIEYHAGANDTIKHRNSVIRSASKYFWRFRPGSASGSYDFSNLTVVGAGHVVMFPVVSVFSRMNFVNCRDMNVWGSKFENCTFTDCNLVNIIKGIGNTNAAANFVNCTFVSTATTNGAALKIISGISDGVGSGFAYLDRCTFTGYGADGTANAAIWNAASTNVSVIVLGASTLPTVYTNPDGDIGEGAQYATGVGFGVRTTITVIDASTGLPVQGARILFYNLATGPNSGVYMDGSTTTDSNGQASKIITRSSYSSFTGVIRVRKSSAAVKYVPYTQQYTVQPGVDFAPTIALTPDIYVT